MADKTPLRHLGVMSSQDLRNEYYRDPALPILIGDEVLKKCARKGLDQGVFVYAEGERREDRGLPPGVLNISEDAKIYMVGSAMAPVGQSSPRALGPVRGQSSWQCSGATPTPAIPRQVGAHRQDQDCPHAACRTGEQFRRGFAPSHGA